ncbi:MAG: hypothetical protein Q4G40_07190 [Brachybacterium sp.]|nr:hypothetical protein [Brachybacterium sp.]
MSVMQAQEPQATEDRDVRLARARAVLGVAERSAARWGGRIDRTALRGNPGKQATPQGEERAEQERTGPTGVVPASPAAAAPTVVRPLASPAPDDHARLPVPSALTALIPHGSLRAGSSLAVAGTAGTSLLLALAAAATGEDAWCAIAGMPHLGLRSALDAGLDPARLAIVPDAGEQQAQVLSALVDGVGVLLLGPHLQVAPALWRTLTARARTRDALILAASPPGRADLQLEATADGWEGIGAGSGRFRRRRVQVRAAGRGISGHRQAEVLLPEVRGLLREVPAVRTPLPEDARTPALDGRPPVLHAVRRAG